MSIKAFDITKEYNREVFLDFLRDFLPDDFEQIEEQTFFEFTNIEEGYKLGFSDSLNLDVYEFRTRSNRDPRVTLTKEVVSCIKNYGYNPNALAIFYSLESNSWRFSLITTDYSFEDGKLKRTYSNPRRFSFKLGKDCKRHTPEQMLFSKGQIRERTENGKTLTVIEDLKSRFAIEVVSNEFFNEYKVFYEDFVQYITGNRFVKTSGNKYEKKPISEQNKEIFNQFEQIANGDYELACKYVRDYIKKLMGRLVFLHFLQKKGWLGVNEESLWGDGNKSYLLDLFKNSSSTEQENFLDKVLEPLFFGMLNTPEAERKALFEEKKWNLQLLSTFNRIPYLNGGLFESDKLDELKVIFPKELFSNEKSPDKERKYQGAIQDYPFTECCGLLDFFERYNFTIDETDPSDMEIGIDPEMLGKIFENLLEDNKDKGAFYTPKEIVQYMCRESLIAYLLTDSTIEEEKIRDFVISHSDNFMESEKSELIQKLKSVKICDPAVGSGAFPMGMLNELYACRHVIEEDTSPVDIKKEIVKENIYGVDIEKGAVDIARLRFWLAIIVDETEPIPLPNLDYKIMQGNSLLECYEGIDLSHMLEKPANGEFDYTEEQRNLLTTKMKDYFNENNHNEKQVKNDIIKELVCELVYTTCGIKPNADKAFALREKIYNGTSDFFLWHTWFNDVFNRPNDCNGFDIVIGNPPYITLSLGKGQKYFTKEQIDVYKKMYPESVDYKGNTFAIFYDKSIQLCTDNGIVSLITPNALLSANSYEKLRKIILQKTNIKSITNFPNGVFQSAETGGDLILVLKKSPLENDLIRLYIDDDFENYKDIYQFQKQSLSQTAFNKNLNSNFLLSSDKKMEILSKITNAKVIELGKIVKFYQGVITGDNNKFLSDKAVSKKWKPIIRGRDINKYSMPTSNTFVLFDKEKLWSNTNEDNFYVAEKLINRQTGDCLIATYDDSKYLTLDTTHVQILINSNYSLKYVLGIFNSELLNFVYKNYVQEAGRTFAQVKTVTLKKLPIFEANKQQQLSIIELVDKILSIKNKDNLADTSTLESQIDELVYNLYGITKEEINIIRKK